MRVIAAHVRARDVPRLPADLVLQGTAGDVLGGGLESGRSQGGRDLCGHLGGLARRIGTAALVDDVVDPERIPDEVGESKSQGVADARSEVRDVVQREETEWIHPVHRIIPRIRVEVRLTTPFGKFVRHAGGTRFPEWAGETGLEEDAGFLKALSPLR